jgi:hypothetical protein
MSFIDECTMTLVSSPSGLRHVQGWYGETLCGKWINYGYKKWGYLNLTSVRALGKMAQGKVYGRSLYCKRCLANYKDVILDD